MNCYKNSNYKEFSPYLNRLKSLLEQEIEFDRIDENVKGEGEVGQQCYFEDFQTPSNCKKSIASQPSSQHTENDDWRMKLTFSPSNKFTSRTFIFLEIDLRLSL